MLLFLNKVNNPAAFEAKIRDISYKLGIDSNWLMFIMSFETAGTLDHTIQNPTTKATGLIQFLPSTASDLGTTVDDLKEMTNIEQLDYVYDYLIKRKYQYGAFYNFYDLYLAIFYPEAIGKSDNYVLPGYVADQNPVFDEDSDNVISIWEIKQVLNDRVAKTVPVNYREYFFGSKKKEMYFRSIRESCLLAA